LTEHNLGGSPSKNASRSSYHFDVTVDMDSSLRVDADFRVFRRGA